MAVEETINFIKKNGKYYIDKPWPHEAEFSIEILRTGIKDTLVCDGPKVTVCVENGFANYLKRQRTHAGWLCTLGQNEYIDDKRFSVLRSSEEPAEL